MCMMKEINLIHKILKYHKDWISHIDKLNDGRLFLLYLIIH